MELMRLVRTTLALMIAAALALLPVGASTVGLVRAVDQAAAAMQADTPDDMSGGHMSGGHMSGGDMAMDDCCPDTKAPPCDGDGGKCPLGFCAAPCVGLTDVASLRFDFPPLGRTALPIPTDQVTSLLGASPPFRPPRV
jgi:hypothetical protein